MMDFKELAIAVLDFLLGFLDALRAGKGWWWFKRSFRREVWKTFIKPAIRNKDWKWIPDAILYLTLCRVLLGKVMALSVAEKVEAQGDRETAFRMLAKD